jgi:hypothetical protein
MPARARVIICLFLASAVAPGCGAADSAVDPGDLALRDLLGVSPELAAGWDQAERARAREVIAHAAAASEDAPDPVRLAQAGDDRGVIVAAMLAVDEQRRARGREPVLLAWVLAEAQQLEVLPVAGEAMDMASSADPSALVFEGWDPAVQPGWAELSLREPGLLAALARQAGYRDEPRPLPVIPAPQAPFAMIFVDAGARSFIAVNPVLLAAQEPQEPQERADLVTRAGAGPATAAARLRTRDVIRAPGGRAADIVSRPNVVLAAGGNPYSFFGSINECAAFQRRRCEACTAEGSCEAVTRDAESGLAECQALGAGDGAGYFLLCINLSLAIGTVSDCADDASQCAQAPGAGNQLLALELNRVFLDDATCASALDDCLADIFGQPDGNFPGPGQPEPPPPPRDVEPSCGGSGANCELSPSCESSCSAGSCDNAVSCGGCEGGSCEGCQGSGCEGGGCDGCESSGGGGGGGGGSSGCDDGGGDGGCGGESCEGGCDGGCDGSGCDGGGCDGGGCDGGGCSSGCEGGDCSGGSGGSCGSSCSVTRRRGHGQTALGVVWLLAPCVFLELRRRRERRRGRLGDSGARA